MSEAPPPDVVVFEGRVYRLDRISTSKPDDLVVVRRVPYETPKLREIGKPQGLENLLASLKNKP